MNNVSTLVWSAPCSRIWATVRKPCCSTMVSSSIRSQLKSWTLLNRASTSRELHRLEPCSKKFDFYPQGFIPRSTYVSIFLLRTTFSSSRHALDWRRSFATKSKPSPGLQSRIRNQLQEKPNAEQPPSPPPASALTPSSQPAQPERGIHIITRTLSTSEIQSIFGSSKRLSSSLASRTLAVLHGRRVNGTLDLVLPLDITRALTPHEIDSALEWLRKRFPVDEDAAILARIEKEEKEAEERELQEIKKAEELGQFRPQSGTFGTKLGESKDIYGRSVFKEIREKNEARLLAEEEQKRQEWLRGEAKYEEQLRTQLQRNTELQMYNPDTVIEARPRADPKERPFLAWVQKHHLRATSLEDPSQITNRQRVLPALAVTLITLAVCYIYAETYEPSPRNQRMWPNVPPAAATVITLIGTNLLIFTLWKAWPPAWRMLNRYFISVPVYPYAISVVGNIFSHQQFRHLTWNMVLLWFIGTRLHDEIGRGNFLALYLGSGTIGSFISFTSRILFNNLTVLSLGASGAVSGLVAAWCMLHANDRLTLLFIPIEWQRYFSAEGWEFLVGITVAEIVSMLLSIRRQRRRFDHWAHLGGLFGGTVWAILYKSRKDSGDKSGRGGGEKEGNRTNRFNNDSGHQILQGLMGMIKK